MTKPGFGMHARRVLHRAGLALLLVTAGFNPAFPQDNPMTSQPVDDEPEVAAPAEPAPPGGNVSAVTPETPGGQRVAAFPAYPAPLPPVRPFAIERAPGVNTPRATPVAPPPAVSVAPPPAAPPVSVPAPNESVPLAPSTPPDSPAVVASLPTTTQPATTEEIEAEEEKTPEPMLVEKQTDAVDIACLRPELLRLVRIAGEHFKGTPVITSGQRNRGRLGSYHRKCMAADFFVPGIERARLAKFLRSLPEAGGVGTYCHTKSVHIDIGEPRNWWQCGFRFRFAQR